MLLPTEVETEKVFAKRDTADGSPAEIPLYIVRPKGVSKSNLPVILLIQEAFGVNSHIQDVCRRFALQGYVVVSPDLYYRTGVWQTFGYTEYPATAKAREPLTEERTMGDLQAVLDYILDLEGADETRVGIIGYCMGGMLSYLTASHFSDRIKTSVVYYGGGLTAQTPQFPVAPVNRTNRIMVPVLGFFGGMDRGIPKEVVEQVDQALEIANIEHAIYYYPEADHGFFCNERQSYHPLTAQDAWHRTLTWFAEKLDASDSIRLEKQ
ncbi:MULTISPECIES: dienelactone hydrolase family protein [unclassified Paenibacillus]|uniref:dienelactone hydrolase family protein n=1 Tax=unclassified Paenibacillus TaxID=185978 RepID=UPI0030FCE83E